MNSLIISSIKKFQFRAIALISIIALMAVVWIPVVQAGPLAIPVQAEFSGNFQIVADAGNSPVFMIEASAAGDAVDLGSFDFKSRAMQNSARPPEGCAPGSSTGIGGMGMMEFSDGVIYLQRISGDACFSFPFIEVDEEWRIAGGRGAYMGASGRIMSHITGDVGSGAFEGSMEGEILRK